MLLAGGEDAPATTSSLR